ncbi:VOC family protein [Tianweitania sp.]|uniref:VOC family protein n=1 Tax=Tianweitania sp. TaxID=2021634 RepID=UPI002898C463|nr:VOC family protein [Tianweitania sp.]
MFSHTTVGTADVETARRFYEPWLRVLGLEIKFADANWLGWKSPSSDRPLFLVTRPYDGQPVSTGNGQMIAFLAERRSDVDRCHGLAIEHAGRCEGKPGLRPAYHPNYYGAYFRDLDGNKLCVCSHGTE